MARTKKDKIFDNKFDEIENKSGPISFDIDASYDSDMLIDESLHEDMLYNKIESVLSKSKYNQYVEYIPDENNDGPEINKSTINEIYSLICNSVQGYTKIEIFSMLTDFLMITPSKFYNALNNKAKEDLIMELDKKMNVLEKKGIRKLF
jgi:hypothetical protein